MPEGTETKGCEASQVRHPLWPKEPRMVRTPNSRTVVLHWGRFCPLGDILALSRDTFKLSQLGACYWHLVSTGQKCVVAQHLTMQPLQQRIIQSIMSLSGTAEKPRFAKSWGHLAWSTEDPGGDTLDILEEIGEELRSAWAKEVTHKQVSGQQAR